MDYVKTFGLFIVCHKSINILHCQKQEKQLTKLIYTQESLLFSVSKDHISYYKLQELKKFKQSLLASI